MKKSMKPDNNNLDAIAAQARKPLPKAGLGLGFFKGMLDGKKNQMNALGKIAGGDLMGGVSQQTGLSPEQIGSIGMKAGMASMGVPPMKKGGMVKKKKC